MTILEKIKNLYWFNEIVKLREILTDLYNNSTGGIPEAPVDGNKYARQDGNWSEVIEGGGSQDLQSVLDNGNTALNKDIILTEDLDDWDGYKTVLSRGSVIFSTPAYDLRELSLNFDGIYPKDQSGNPRASLVFSGKGVYNFPEKTDFITYTLATTEDIYAIGALIPTYADNAAAITGGLALHGLYKTATGEIRVRV